MFATKVYEFNYIIYIENSQHNKESKSGRLVLENSANCFTPVYGN